MSKKEAEETTEATNLHPDAMPDEEASRDLMAVDQPGPGALVPGSVAGEISASDIKIPTVKLIQKMSENPANLPCGTLTVNSDVVVQSKDGDVVATVVSLKKQYEEVLPFGAGIPKRFDRLEDAVRDGYKLCRSKQDRDSGVPIVEETALALMVFHQPEGSMDRSFPFDLAGIRGVPAVWYLKSYAYGSVAKQIFTKLNFELRNTELLTARWRVSVEKRKNSFGEFFVPHIALLPETNSDEFVAAVKEQISFA